MCGEPAESERWHLEMMDRGGGIFFVFLFYFISPLFFIIFRKGDRGVVYSSGIYLKSIYLFSPPSPPLWMRGWICTYFIYFVPRGTSDFSPPPPLSLIILPGGGLYLSLFYHILFTYSLHGVFFLFSFFFLSFSLFPFFPRRRDSGIGLTG